jgi:hypothetical protein
MSNIAPSRDNSEYVGLIGFTLASVVVVWLLQPDAQPLAFMPIFLRTIAVCIIPILVSAIFNIMAGRVLLTVLILAYIQHGLHVLN